MVGLKNYYQINGYPESYHCYDEVWVVMRYPRDMSKDFRHVPELAPPLDLFHWYQRAKHSGTFTWDAFRGIYVPRYIEYLLSNRGAQDALDLLWQKLRSGKDIALACTCHNESMCHRAILGGIARHAGYNVVVSGEDAEYYYYGTMYWDAYYNQQKVQS